MSRTKGGCLKQGTIDFVWTSGQGLANKQTAQVGVDQNGAVSVPPVEGEESAFSRFQFGGLLFSLVGLSSGGFIGSLVTAVVGAVVLLWGVGKLRG